MFINEPAAKRYATHILSGVAHLMRMPTFRSDPNGLFIFAAEWSGITDFQAFVRESPPRPLSVASKVLRPD